MARMELSLSRRGNDFPKQSPLKEPLAINNHIMGDIPSPSGFMPSPPSSSQQQCNDDDNAIPSIPTIDNDDDEQRSTTVEKTGLCHELFTYFINRSRTKKLLSFLIITSLVLVVVEYILYNNVHISTFTSNFLDWMAVYGDVAVMAYIVMMSILTLFFVPPSLFVFASGFIFQDVYGGSGIVIAWVASFIGTLIGGSLGFWRARFLSRDLVEILMRRYPILRAVDVAIVKNSLRVMMLMRLNPLIPFGVMNYIFGISGVDLATFILAMPAVMPWYLFLVCLGAVSSSMYSEGIDDNVFGVVLISTGVASGIIGLVITWRFAKKELQKDAEMDKWRVGDPKELPQVGTRSRSPTPTEMMMAVLPTPSSSGVASLDDNIDDGNDEENPSSNYDPSLVIHDIQKATDYDEYNDNDNTIDDTIGNTSSSDSKKLGEKVKQVVRKLKFNSKSSEEEPNAQAAATRISPAANTNIIFEERDLGFTDYFRTQVLGQDGYDDNGNAIQQNYRNHLDWTEIILDDFS
mmetsp:Transcript_20922/g.31200  ORF Transcript_20922/g.31200 Transcript_20922/m.31200 type:complete len:518 (-) Transcript_20922:100-1653(-)